MPARPAGCPARRCSRRPPPCWPPSRGWPRGRLTLIGVGGVRTGRQVLPKLRAGASLVQLYTGFALHGPALIARLKRELLAALDADGFATVADAIGADL